MTRKIVSILIIPFASLFLLTGFFGENKETKEALGQYELSKAKNDFDGMFLALSTLYRETEETRYKQELEQIKDVIVKSELLKQKLADHNHEDAFNISVEILELYPEHREALNALRESGNILFYKFGIETELRKIKQILNEKETFSAVLGLKQVSSSGELSGANEKVDGFEVYKLEVDAYPEMSRLGFSSTKVKLIGFKTSSGFTFDRLNKMSSHLRKIAEFHESILNLDKNVTDSIVSSGYILEVEKSVSKFKLLILDIMLDSAVAVAATNHDIAKSMINSLGSTGDPSYADIWFNFKPSMKTISSDLNSSLKQLRGLVRTENDDKMSQLIKDYFAEAGFLIENMLEPKGNMRDWGQAVDGGINSYKRARLALDLEENANALTIEEHIAVINQFIKQIEPMKKETKQSLFENRDKIAL